MVFTGDYGFDTGLLLDFIQKLSFRTGSARLKKFQIKHSEGNSGLYGDTWRGYLSPTKNRVWDEKRKRFMTKLKSDNPELESIFQEFRDFHFPDFEFSQVQINLNYKIPRHIDGANVGKSYLVCLGNYTGGLTCIEYSKDNIKKVDGRKEPISFDGSKYYHWVEDFEGDRYSLVFFDY